MQKRAVSIFDLVGEPPREPVDPAVGAETGAVNVIGKPAQREPAGKNLPFVGDATAILSCRRQNFGGDET